MGLNAAPAGCGVPSYLFDDLNASIARHVDRLPAALSLLRRLEPTSRILRRLARIRPRADDDRVTWRGAPCAGEEGRAARAEHCACCGGEARASRADLASTSPPLLGHHRASRCCRGFKGYTVF